jgi:hypothetical protein
MECAKSVLGVQLNTRVLDSTAGAHFNLTEALQRELFVVESEERAAGVLIEDVSGLLTLIGAF